MPSLALLEGIGKNVDNLDLGCGIFVDIQKAFDTVEHDILFSKFEHYGVRDLANEWFKSYLSNRKQEVSINGYHSNLADAKNCCPSRVSSWPTVIFNLY